MNSSFNYQSLSLDSSQDKKAIIVNFQRMAESVGYTIVDVDDQKPWGGYIRFDTSNSEAFVEQFFSDADVEITDESGKPLPLSPKFLLVSPHQRLSWQRHQRRSEVWKFLTDGGAYSKSIDPDNQPVYTTNAGEIVEIEQGFCHRLMSQSDDYVLVAEVWRHTDINNLSAEEDNERLQDDYQRSS